MIETVHFKIDGDEVHVEDWSCSMVANGGYEKMSGRVAIADLRSNIDQGSIVEGYRSSGGQEEFFYGRMAAPPRIKHGKAELTVIGPKVRVEKANERLMYQLNDATAFVLADAQPHGYALKEKYQQDSAHGTLRWIMPKGESFVNNDDAGFVLWVPDVPITRIRFNFTKAGSPTNDFRLRGRVADGPDGSTSATFFDINVASVADGANRDHDVTRPRDLLYLAVECVSASGTLTTAQKIGMTNLRVNGIAMNTNRDFFSTTDIVQDVGGRAGYDDLLVQTSGLNALPKDWTDGPWSDLLDEVADMDDWRWLVLGDRRGLGPVIDYGPYERVWYVSGRHNATDELEPMELYNAARIGYELRGGTPASVRVEADPDPLADKDIDNEWYEELSNAQDAGLPSSASGAKQQKTLAESYGEQKLEALTVRRARGPVTFGEVSDGVGTHPAHAVRAGDVLVYEDYTFLDGSPLPPQRIVSIDYSSKGKATAVLTEDINLARRMSKHMKKKGHHRKRRRRG